MTAALLVGGAEDHADDSPGRMLSHLDHVLRESRVGGFSTCLCADVCLDGQITLANAGHLPPYCRGNEISIENSFPLGVDSASIDYSELVFSLNSGDSLTFLLDELVEARSRTGELYGFERTTAIRRYLRQNCAYGGNDRPGRRHHRFDWNVSPDNITGDHWSIGCNPL